VPSGAATLSDEPSNLRAPDAKGATDAATDRRRADVLLELYEAIVPCEQAIRTLSTSSAPADANHIGELSQAVGRIGDLLDVLRNRRPWLSSRASAQVDGIVAAQDQLTAAREELADALRAGTGFPQSLARLQQRLTALLAGLSELRTQVEMEFRSTIGVS
jgi:hypothetical protein